MIKSISDILIVTDIDGTLLRAEKGVSAENKRAIERFVEKGGDFTVSTGRVIEAAKVLVKDLPITVPSIHVNGGYFYDWQKEEIIFPHYLPKLSVDIVSRIIGKFPFVDCYFANEHAVNLITSGDVLKSFSASVTKAFYRSSFSGIPDKVYKFVIVSNPDMMGDVQCFIESLPHPNIKYVLSCPFLLEILPEDNSKGNALRRLPPMCNKILQNTFAVGDYENDLDMIKAAGVGCAVGNACQSVKNVADIILPSCEDNAIARLIEMIEEKYQ